MAANQPKHLTVISGPGILNIDEDGNVSVILPSHDLPMALRVRCNDPKLLAVIWEAISHFDHDRGNEERALLDAFEIVVEMCKRVSSNFKSSEQLLEWLACHNIHGVRDKTRVIVKQARKALGALRAAQASQTMVKSARKV